LAERASADAPRLRRAVLDSLARAMHEQPEVQAAIKRAGAELRFLPLHSADFSPIEVGFAQLKTFLRAAWDSNLAKWLLSITYSH
jgi:transposase